MNGEFGGTPRGKGGRGGALWEIKAPMFELPDFSEAEQIAHDGFATAVFVGAVGMQAVAATAGVYVHQR